MKILRIINIAIISVTIYSLCIGCSENINEGPFNPSLEGLYSNVQFLEYTFTIDDYKNLSENPINIEKAKAENVYSELQSVGTLHQFNSEISPIKYIPAYLNDPNFPYFVLTEKSKIDITYRETGVTDPIIAQVARAISYTVSKDDYINAWGSDKDYIEAFAPMTPASVNIPSILQAAHNDAKTGEYAIVSYDEADENPIFTQPINFIYVETFASSQGDFIIHDVVIPSELSFIWSCSSHYGMKATAYNGWNYPTESWLISPLINIGGSKASFSFEEAINYFTDVETAKNEASVWVRPAGGEWEQLTGYTFPDNLSWNFVPSGEVELSKYCGSSIQIGFKYKSDAIAGTWEIKNFVLTAEEGSVGGNPGYSVKPIMKTLANTPETTNKVAVYSFDGSKWVPAKSVIALQPNDYADMGFSNNKLEDAATYLPIYLKNHMPNAVEGTKEAIIYNGKTCSVLVYDGQNWSINNNDLQTKTAQFIKQGNDWKFVKYPGMAYFNYTTKLTLDRKYLFVADGICAIPIATPNTYGYMGNAPVKIADNMIEEKNEVNAFTFASSTVIGDKVYNLSEGQFFIVDSNGRYSYMSNTYNSFNLADAPAVSDGAVDPNYIFTATCNREGLWTITNVGKGKWIQYTTFYSTWGCYDAEQAKSFLPSLYILSEE